MKIIKAKKPASTVRDIAPGLSQQDKAPFAPPAGQDFPLEQGENSPDPTIICTTQDKPACPSPMNMPCLLSGVLSDVMNMTPEQWVDYVDTTPATALRKRFKQEANAHRAMKQRVKTKGAVVHPAFEDFKSFLTIVGPAPTKTATVDRIDPTTRPMAPISSGGLRSRFRQRTRPPRSPFMTRTQARPGPSLVWPSTVVSPPTLSASNGLGVLPIMS